MKYLKPYKIFESNNDLVQNVREILLPISDMGYDIDVNEHNTKRWNSELSIRVFSKVDKSLLITDEVKEEFIRMKDYLESEGYDSIKVNFFIEQNSVMRNVSLLPLEDFINIKEPIKNLLFVTQKKTQESSSNESNASFDWLRKQSNERYIDLMFILQSDIFDEFNIVSKTNETFSDDGDTVYPEHKFWVFRMKESSSTDVDTSNPDEIGNKTIDYIIVFNIKEDEKDHFYNEVLSLKEKVKDLVGKELLISEEIIDDGYNYDYIIKLNDK